GITGHQAMPVIDLDHQPVIAIPAGEGHATLRRREDRRALRRRDVDPLVRTRPVEDRMAPTQAEGAREIPLRRKDRGICLQSLTLLLDRRRRLAPARRKELRPADHRIQVVCRRERLIPRLRVQLVQRAGGQRRRARTTDTRLVDLLVDRVQPREETIMLVLLREIVQRTLELRDPFTDRRQLRDEELVLLRQALRAIALALLDEESARKRGEDAKDDQHRPDPKTNDFFGQTKLTHRRVLVGQYQQRPMPSSHGALRLKANDLRGGKVNSIPGLLPGP